jgi:hypothetical protein
LMTAALAVPSAVLISMSCFMKSPSSIPASCAGEVISVGAKAFQ